jgi:single-strand DNA-binding protein
MNRVELIGNLGQRPELRSLPLGQGVSNFSVAVNERYKDSEHTEWFNIVVYGKLAETCSRHLDKGRRLFVEGRLRTRKWEKDGQNFQRTEVIASRIEFLGAKPEGGVTDDIDHALPAEEEIPS